MRPITILFLLVIYVVFQFCWWAYLLVDLNTEVYEHKIELVRLTGNASPAVTALEESQLLDKISQRKKMVLGEGLVFLSLLIWGSIVTYRSFRRDFELARLQKNFLLSITHEFKSPLASIRLYLETLKRHDLDQEKESRFIQSALQDTDRLNQLVENALLANLIDHEGHFFSQEPVAFSHLVEECVRMYQSRPGFPEIRLELEQHLQLTGDRSALLTLLSNLIENAAKYSPEKTPVIVSVGRHPEGIFLRVADTGIGIRDEEKSKIFQKFYRSGNEETRSTKGTGLGLYLVKYIVEEHHARIKVSDNHPRGTIFEVVFRTLS